MSEKNFDLNLSPENSRKMALRICFQFEKRKKKSNENRNKEEVK